MVPEIFGIFPKTGYFRHIGQCWKHQYHPINEFGPFLVQWKKPFVNTSNGLGGDRKKIVIIKKKRGQGNLGALVDQSVRH